MMIIQLLVSCISAVILDNEGIPLASLAQDGPATWKSVNGLSYFTYVNLKRNYFDAKKYCNLLDAELATVRNKNHIASLRKAIPLQTSYPVWVGLSFMENNWVWSENSTMKLKANISLNNSNSCAHLNEYNGIGTPVYSSSPCDIKKSFACRKEKVYQALEKEWNPEYQVFKIKLNYFNARIFCQHIGADLIIIYDKKMNCYLQRLISNDSSVWIGLQRFGGNLRFVDGSTTTDTFINIGKESWESAKDYSYASYYLDTDGFWYEENAYEDEKFFVCQRYINAYEPYSKHDYDLTYVASKLVCLHNGMKMMSFDSELEKDAGILQTYMNTRFSNFIDNESCPKSGKCSISLNDNVIEFDPINSQVKSYRILCKRRIYETCDWIEDSVCFKVYDSMTYDDGKRICARYNSKVISGLFPKENGIVYKKLHSLHKGTFWISKFNYFRENEPHGCFTGTDSKSNKMKCLETYPVVCKRLTNDCPELLTQFTNVISSKDDYFISYNEKSNSYYGELTGRCRCTMVDENDNIYYIEYYSCNQVTLTDNNQMFIKNIIGNCNKACSNITGNYDIYSGEKIIGTASFYIYKNLLITKNISNNIQYGEASNTKDNVCVLQGGFTGKYDNYWIENYFLNFKKKSEWSAWSKCPVSCGGGIIQMNKICFSNNCEGNNKYLLCNQHKCKDPLSIYQITMYSDSSDHSVTLDIKSKASHNFVKNYPIYKGRNTTYVIRHGNLTGEIENMEVMQYVSEVKIYIQQAISNKMIVKDNTRRSIVDGYCLYTVMIYTSGIIRAGSDGKWFSMKFFGTKGESNRYFMDYLFPRGSILEFKICNQDIGETFNLSIGINNVTNAWIISKIYIYTKYVASPIIFTINAALKSPDSISNYSFSRDQATIWFEFGTSNKNLTIFNNSAASWKTAEEACNHYHGNLLSFKNINDYNTLFEDKLDSNNGYWLGLNYNGSFIWSSGIKLSLNLPTVDYHGCVALTSCGLVKTNCNRRYSFICERVKTDGGWSKWIGTSACSVACGSGFITQTRSCTNPTPKNGGKECVGDQNKTTICDEGVRGCQPFEIQRPDLNINKKQLVSIITLQTKSWSLAFDYKPIIYADWSSVLHFTKEVETKSTTCGSSNPGIWMENYYLNICSCNNSSPHVCRSAKLPLNEYSNIKIEQNYILGEYKFSVFINEIKINNIANPNVQRFYNVSVYASNPWNSAAGGHIKDLYFKNIPKVNGTWNNWSNTSDCSVTCGIGRRIMKRNCTYHEMYFGEVKCEGNDTKIVNCTIQSCLVDGSWSVWSNVSKCSVSCGVGYTTKSRSCTPPENGGVECIGDKLKSLACEIIACPGVWATWSQCTSSIICGNGIRTRLCKGSNSCNGSAFEDCTGEGACKTTTFSEGGKSCDDICELTGKICDPYLPLGDALDLFTSNKLLCPKSINGDDAYEYSYDPHFNNEIKRCVGYTGLPKRINCSATPPTDTLLRLCHCIDKDAENALSWSPWTECSATCDGTRQSIRHCILNSVGFCSQNTIRTENCSRSCPVHGGLSEWSLWSNCSVTCGGGSRDRYRDCTNPTPYNGGFQCIGYKTQSEICATNHCPVNGNWTTWSKWSTACSQPCNTGSYVRNRYCTNPRPLYGGLYCLGSNNETTPCNTHACKSVIVDIVCTFAQVYTPSLSSRIERFKFEYFLSHAVKESYDLGFKENIKSVKLFNLRKGSIIADFQIAYTHLESYQLVYLQDSIQIDGAIGKNIVVVNGTTSFNSSEVPNAPPTNITVTSISSNSISVKWSEINEDNSNGVIKGYLLFYRQKSHLSSPYHVVATDKLKEDISGLDSNTKYVFRLLGYNEIGNGIASDIFYKTTLQLAPTESPTNLTAFTISYSSIYVLWDHVKLADMNGEPLGYHIYHHSQYTNNIIITTSYLTNNFLLNNLISSEMYIINVCAYNAVGNGPCESIQAETSGTGIGPTDELKNLQLLYRSHHELTASWDQLSSSNKNDITGYRIELRLHQTDGIKDMNTPTVKITVQPSVLTYQFNLLISNSVYSISVSGVNKDGIGRSIKISAETCKCERHIYTNYYMVEPYVSPINATGGTSGIFPHILNDLIHETCRECNQLNVNYSTTVSFINNGKSGFSKKRNMDRVLDDIDQFTQLSFPLTLTLKDRSLKTAFVPILKYPGGIYIVRAPSVAEQVKLIAKELFRVLPFLLIDFLFIVLSGMIVWALGNCSNNEKEFSSSAIEGLKQAWYWAYITQTTIGYGDFVPKSKRTRFFAIIWMVIGLVMNSILTGALTTAFTMKNIQNHKIYGQKVAAITNSFEETLVILRNGRIDKSRVYSSVHDLKSALLETDIDGILIDAYTAGNNKDILDQSLMNPVKLIEYHRYYGVVLSGALANIANNLQDNIISKESEILKQLEIHTKKMMPKTPQKPTSLLDSDSPSFPTTILILSTMLLVACFAGLARWYCCNVKKKHTAVAPADENLYDTVLKFKPLWREVIKFRYLLFTRVDKLTKRMEEERIKLYHDKGASSLRNNRYTLYSPQEPSCSKKEVLDTLSTVVQTFSQSTRNDNCEYEGSDNINVSEEQDTTMSSLNDKELHLPTRKPSFVHSDDEENEKGKNIYIEENKDNFNYESDTSEVDGDSVFGKSEESNGSEGDGEMSSSSDEGQYN